MLLNPQLDLDANILEMTSSTWTMYHCCLPDRSFYAARSSIVMLCVFCSAEFLLDDWLWCKHDDKVVVQYRKQPSRFSYIMYSVSFVGHESVDLLYLFVAASRASYHCIIHPMPYLDTYTPCNIIKGLSETQGCIRQHFLSFIPCLKTNRTIWRR